MAGLADNLNAAVEEIDGERKQATIEAQRREIRNLKKEIADLEAARAKIATLLDLHDNLSASRIDPPQWLTPKAKGSGHRGTACSILSDSHFDEVVSPSEVDYMNAYDRRIAERRLRRYFDRLISVPRDYLSGVDYDGLVLMLGGDLVSGNIHDELRETNEDTICGTVVHWTEQLSAGIRQAVDHYGKVHVPCVVGNHGRLTRKPRAKGRARDNFDWLIYKLLARDFAGDKRITFDIPDAADAMFNVYGTRFLLTHGDQFRGGSGIAGAFSPLMLGSHRKGRRQQAAGKPYDWMVMGHWHQYIHARGLIVNGSSKGYDEYAFVSNFDPEQPQQALFTVTPEHGITFAAPIQVADRRKEGW